LRKGLVNLEIDKYQIISKYCKVSDVQKEAQRWKFMIVRNVSIVTEVAGMG
jgi:hypothetical protein